ncbi:P-loop NTPase fold protein [Nonomuraea zeae]|uniref:KAP NTPase domain-containing protein n=1 Tax=Nonomuraea zeae TaxID=1642303 RepID=A0A5S4H1U8_9ACTN|nr:P-loop NTPase fold protein [Nonomuraea zeae]TMR38892.1 hypothetical protein ETD85_03525 [Nonomuraea zeae]
MDELGGSFKIWPPPRMQDVDPHDFGVMTGAAGPRGRDLNPYIPRDVDQVIQECLRKDRAVVVACERGSGATRTLYEVLNQVLPREHVLIARRPGEFDSADLGRLDHSGSAVLWIDQLGAHYGVLGPRLLQALAQWVRGEKRWLVATVYDRDLLRDKEFARLDVPVVELPSGLSSAERAAERSLYGHDDVREMIGLTPPERPRSDLFSGSVRAAAGSFTGDTAITAAALAERLVQSHPEYAGGLLRQVTFPVGKGERRPVTGWLGAVRDRSGPPAEGEVIDGRQVLLALAGLDPALGRSMGDKALSALRAESSSSKAPQEESLAASPESFAVSPESFAASPESLATSQESFAASPESLAASHESLSPQREESGTAPGGEREQRKHVRLLVDDTVGTDGDELGRIGVARALQTQLRSLVQELPGRSFLVHIDGAWGTGKSTLLRFLRELDAEDDDPWLVVEYDAWRQTRGGPPWLSLLQALRRAVRAERNGPLFALRERARLIDARQWLAAGLMAAVGVLVLVPLAGVSLTTWGDLAKLAGGLVPLLAALWLFAKAAARFVSLDSRRSARQFVDTRADPMEDLAVHFDWLLGQARRPVLLLVDDLDRCPEPFVIELLDAVQKLMRERGRKEGAHALIVVVAADGRWVRSSYDDAYQAQSAAIGQPGTTVGSLFLEKLFQISVPVPRLSEELKSQYLTDLLARQPGKKRTAGATELTERLKNATPAKALEIYAEAEPIERVQAADMAIERLVTAKDAARETRHVLEPYAPLLPPTPRAMKRFVMAYSMLRAVRTAEGSVVGVGPLALWTVLQTRWPLLAEYLQATPESVGLFHVGADRLPPSAPAGLAPLFTDPPPELRLVMNHPAGPLNESAIRECSGQAIAGRREA